MPRFDIKKLENINEGEYEKMKKCENTKIMTKNKEKIRSKKIKNKTFLALVLFSLLVIVVAMCLNNSLGENAVYIILSGYVFVVVISTIVIMIRKIYIISQKSQSFVLACFEKIDDVILGEQTFEEKFCFINKIYLPGGEIDKLVGKEGITILGKRKGFLESKIFEKENQITMPSNFVFSILSSIVASYILFTISGGTIGWLFIILFVLFGVAMILTIVYYMSAKSDEDIVIFEIELMRVDEKLAKFLSAKP